MANVNQPGAAQIEKQTIVCPRCEQGAVLKVRVKANDDTVYLCDECDAIWFSQETIAFRTFNHFKLYMERIERRALWDEVEIDPAWQEPL